MSVTLYKIQRWGSMKVESHEFARVTEKFAIDANGRREALRSAYDNWFPTEQGAIEHRRMKLKDAISSAQSTLDYVTKELEKFNAKYPEANDERA